MLAGCDGALEIRAHRLIAPCHLHHDLDGWIVQKLGGVSSQQLPPNLDHPWLADIPDEHAAEAELDARTPSQLSLPGQHALGHAGAHSAQPDQADVQGTY